MLKTSKINLITVLLLNLVSFCFVVPSFSGPKGTIFVVELRGDVQLKKARESKFKRARVGDFLEVNDQLRLGRNASATVICGSEKEWKVPPGRTSFVLKGCPPSERYVPEGPSRR